MPTLWLIPAPLLVKLFDVSHVNKLNTNDPQTTVRKALRHDVAETTVAMLYRDEVVATEVDEYIDEYLVDESRAFLLR